MKSTARHSVSWQRLPAGSVRVQSQGSASIVCDMRGLRSTLTGTVDVTETALALAGLIDGYSVSPADHAALCHRGIDANVYAVVLCRGAEDASISW